MSTSIARLKRRLRDTLILGAHRLNRRSRLAGKRVIVLHDVEAPEADAFRVRMEFIREKFEILSMADLLQNPAGDRIQVAVTFDDGYASWAETAAPLLSELEIPAVFFACSGLVDLEEGESRRFYRENIRRMRPFAPLRRSHIELLSENPLFEIGSHTVGHADLGAITAPDQLRAQIADDRVALEKLTGKRVRYFAWPFGGRAQISETARHAIRAAGFEAAFTTIPGRNAPPDDALLIGRDMLSLDDPTSVWEARLHGAYDTLSRLKG